MKTRQLGNSDLYITPIGFGAWAIGGSGWEFAWGAQDDRDSVAAIREALDCGINWIDTAAVYGLGHSEEVVARALEGVANRPYVFTKCERVWNEKREIGKSLKADSVRRECEASLTRLLKLVELRKTIAGRHGRTPGAVAVAWVLRDPAVTGAIVGARRPGQIRETVAAAELRLTPEDLAEIDRFFAAEGTAPVPGVV